MPDIELLLEAERRGILPDDKKELLAEARNRGLVPSVSGKSEIAGSDLEKQMGGPVQSGIVQARSANPPATPGLKNLGQNIGKMLGNIPHNIGDIVSQSQPTLTQVAAPALPPGLEQIATMMASMAKSPEGITGGLKNLGETLAGNVKQAVQHPIDTGAKQIIDKPVSTALAAAPLLKGPQMSEALSNLAQKIYGGAAKMPVTKKWLRTMGPEDQTVRQATVAGGIENRIPFTQYGFQKASQFERETRGIIDNIVNTGAQTGDLLSQEGKIAATGITGAGDSVYTEDLLKGLDKAYVQAANSGDPRRAIKMVDKVAEDFMQRPKVVSTSELQKIKRQMYKEAEDYTGEFKSIYDTSQKGIAHEAMTTLEKMYPQLNALNEKDQLYIRLREAIGKRVGIEENKNLAGLESKVLLSSSKIAAIIDATIGHPAIKSQLAFALDAAAKSNGISPRAKAALGIAANVPRENKNRYKRLKKGQDDSE